MKAKWIAYFQFMANFLRQCSMVNLHFSILSKQFNKRHNNLPILIFDQVTESDYAYKRHAYKNKKGAARMVFQLLEMITP